MQLTIQRVGYSAALRKLRFSTDFAAEPLGKNTKRRDKNKDIF